MKNLILNKTSKWIIISVLLLAGLIMSVYNLLIVNNKAVTDVAEEKEEIMSVETVKVVSQDISDNINLSGITEPLDKVMVSSKTTGKVISFNVKEGESVYAGQAIAQLEQDSILLASYNNAKMSLINTVSTTNQDISNAELAITTAEMNLINTKINAEENIKNTELAIDSAKIAFQNAEKSLDNTQSSSEQSIQNVYDNILVTMQSNLLTINTVLIVVGDIIGEEPGMTNANDDYEDVLGVKDMRSLNDTESLFLQTKINYENAKNNYDNLNTLSLNNEIDSIASDIATSLSLTKDVLESALVMLDNTITKSDFTPSDLSILKTSINTNLTNVNTAISTLQLSQQAIISSKLLDTSSSDNVVAVYESAKKNLETSEQGLVLVETQSKMQIDASEKHLKSTEANLESIKKRSKLQINLIDGQINSISAQLKNTTIIASISGVLNQVLVEVGEMAIAGKPIISIVNTESIKIELAITEFDIGRISNEQELKILLSAYPEEEFLGHIYYVGLVADQISKKFPIKIQVSNENKKIKAGMVAQVEILLEEQKDVLVIPKTAVFTEESFEKVYTIDENKCVKILSVKTEFINEETVLVKEGLAEGDTVVVNGNYDLKEGDKVNIK
ncbi:efflux RND transporter periplasmic adaptor subunit [Candidatus Parcubacteria bacterium]|nr:efflux RND transporter periplasmic adaptor subunit [Candidatus Parcubacteria bacterium]